MVTTKKTIPIPEIDPQLAVSPLYQKRAKEEAELQKKSINNLTVAERIKRRTHNQRFTMRFKDGKDIIKLEMRGWTKKDLVLFDQNFPVMDEPSKRGEEAFEYICDFLGHICVDKSLNAEFWRSGDWGVQTFYEMRHYMNEAMANAVVDARDFR